MRTRLRPAHNPQRLAEIYRTPHQHGQWRDHQVRVAVTVQIAHALTGPVATGADLSCGDGAILSSLRVGRRTHGDLAPGWPVVGPIEHTLPQLEPVDLLVCTETLEHLDDPDAVLHLARKRAAHLVVSTPVGAHDDTNPEHYWSWDRGDVEAMLRNAGWTPVLYCELDVRPSGGDYRYGIWGLR